MKEAWTNNGEGLLPSRCPLGEQHRPSHHQTTARKKWTKEDNKFAITCYLKAIEESQRGYRKWIHRYWIEEGRFEIEEQHLTCQVRSILKTKKLSEVEIEALNQKVTTPQETVEVLIKNDPVEDPDVTPVTESGVKQNHPAGDSGMEETDELHQNDDTQRIRMMQENSSDSIPSHPMPSLQGIDALKVKGTVSEVSDICNIRVKNLGELKDLLRARARLVRNKVGAIANKKEFKEPY